MRKERDSLGEKEVPDDALYGVQTVRAVENFPVTGRTAFPELIDSYIILKKACAEANMELEKLDPKKGEYILEACKKLHGSSYDQFKIDVFQAGAGTSLNMNVNEVIANKALELAGKEKGDYDHMHPNDHVNMSQSTNDTYPTASHLALIDISQDLVEDLKGLKKDFQEKGKEFSDIAKSGRTHLMDATPVTLGDEFFGYARTIERSFKNLETSLKELYELPIGGTATGTGVNTPEGFRDKVVKKLSSKFDIEFISAENSFEMLQSRMPMGNFMGALKNLAHELIRIANDLRLLSSGPKTGMSEIKLPAVQPGSSIMPGKINPVMAECLNMISFHIVGNATTVDMAVQAGQMELNVMTPVITYNIMESVWMLNNFLPVFRERCVQGISANRSKCREHFEFSASLATLLSPKIGYMKAAELAKESNEKDILVPKLAVKKGIITEQEAEELFSTENAAESKYDNSLDKE
ncbi:MAG: aspartate ammonia-lyase [Candidatus Saliniplasma sp.]